MSYGRQGRIRGDLGGRWPPFLESSDLFACCFHNISFLSFLAPRVPLSVTAKALDFQTILVSFEPSKPLDPNIVKHRIDVKIPGKWYVFARTFYAGDDYYEKDFKSLTPNTTYTVDVVEIHKNQKEGHVHSVFVTTRK